MLLSIIEVFAQGFAESKQVFRHQLMNPSFSNPFYMIPTIALFTFLLELYMPKKLDYHPIKRKGFALDLFYVIFTDYLLMVVGFYALSKVATYLFDSAMGTFGVTSYLIFDITELNGVVQFLIIFIILDFLQWFGHYLLHRVDFLWHFHKIHHAQEDLGFASTRRFHWVEFMVFKPLLFMPFILLNVNLSQFLIVYFWIGLTFTFFSHTNIKVNARWFNKIFISPDTHYWHHASNLDRRYGVNFASTLTIWDHLFGYFYYPRDEEGKKPVLGVEDQNRMPKTFIGQFFYPFQQIIKRKPKPRMSKSKN